MARNKTQVMLWPGAESRDAYARDFASSIAANGAEVTEFSLGAWKFGLCESDFLLVHWPEAAAQGRYGVFRRASFILWVISVWVFRLRGGTVAWVFHNERPHDEEKFFVERYLMAFVPAVDLLMSPSHTGLDIAERKYRRLRPAVREIARLGEYERRFSSREVVSADSSRKTLVTFGHLRPYKGLDALIDSFPRSDIDLLIVGKCNSVSAERNLIRRCETHENIELRLGYLSDEELEEVLACADGAVFAMRDSLHSGAVLRARSAGLPTLVSSVGAMREYAALDSGISLFDHPVRSRDIEAFVNSLDGRHLLDVDELKWPNIGKRVSLAIEKAVQARRTRRDRS